MTYNPEVVLSIILSVAGVAAIVLIGAGISFLRQKTRETAARAEDTKWFNIANLVANAIDDALASLGGTIIAEIQEKNADGKITVDELETIVRNVKKEAGKLINDTVKFDVLTDIAADWDDWLETKVRAAIERQFAIRPVKNEN